MGHQETCAMPIKKHLVPAAFLAILTLLEPQCARALPPSDFTLGPGGKIAIAIDTDSTTAGCLSTDTSQCDSYSLKIPVKLDPSGDFFSTDLNGNTELLTLVIFSTASQLCTGNSFFAANFTASSLKLSQTKSSESAKFSGLAFGGSSGHGAVMVPISFKLKASRKTGRGTLTVKGLGQGLAAIKGATVDVRLEVGEVGNDTDTDASCATVPATFKTSP
jgi:hypothetical protein